MTARRRRVLVVEDEALVAMLLEDMLTDFGCQLLGPAANVETAFELVAAGGIDFALLDVNLGGATSFGVAGALRDLGVPFAFVTGYGRAGVRFDFREAPVLSKPIDEAELARVLGVRRRELCTA
jgi:CheY-like chemotaxis protein